MNRLLILGISAIVFVGCQNTPKQQAIRREQEMAQWKTEVDAKIQEKKEERQKYLQQHPGLKADVAEAIREGALARGMTQEQVLLSWQNPYDINSSVGPWGTRDQWVYEFKDTSYSLRKAMISPDWFFGKYYLYFSNGVLDSWQQSF